MSTRSCYVFKDGRGDYGVYVHCDGYPTGAAEKILGALKYAWDLPRFEADEFAAAFVAAEKDGPGGVRLLRSAKEKDMPGDIEYLYVIENTMADNMNAKLKVTAYAINFLDDKSRKKKKLFTCELETLKATAKMAEKGE